MLIGFLKYFVALILPLRSRHSLISSVIEFPKYKGKPKSINH